jgi:hypothetical protein
MSRPRATGLAQSGLAQFAAEQQARLAQRAGAGSSQPRLGSPQPRAEPRAADAEVSLSPSVLAAIAASVAAALSRAPPAAASEAAGATAVEQKLGDLVAEVRTLIENVGSPAQGATVVVQKTKRYELGASTSREKVPEGGGRAARASGRWLLGALSALGAGRWARWGVVRWGAGRAGRAGAGRAGRWAKVCLLQNTSGTDPGARRR